MDKIKNILFVVLAATVMLACESEDDGSNLTNSAIQEAVSAAATNGVWTITYYWDTDKEETDDYAGYTFEFGADGTLTATNGTNTVTGTWSVTVDDDSSNDDDGNDVDFNINFTSPADFEELSDDWDVKSYSNVKIELEDVSGGNGGTDFLTFEKN